MNKPLVIKYICGHTVQLFRSIDDPGIKEYVEQQQKKTCGCIQCKEAFK